MKRIAAAGTVALAIVTVVCGVALADNGTKPAKPATPAPKVYVCHHTGSPSNPYVLIHVSSRSAPGRGEHGDIVLGSSPGTCPAASTASIASSSNVNAATTKRNEEGNESATAEQNENAADLSKSNEEGNESGTAEQNENAADVSKSNEEGNESGTAEENENSAAPKAHESDDNEANNASDENHSESGD